MAVALNILAADIHKRMVEDNRFGYSWSERFGATEEEWTVDGIKVKIKVGDYDCSSSTITAWKLALQAAGVTLGNATYTGNMRSVFLATGLFEARTDFGNAQRGDLYLNEANHVAMCQGGGKLSEFSINEFGGVYGGLRGDQTGNEAKMSNYYYYPWDVYLHYIGTKTVGGEPDKSRVVQLWTPNNSDAQRWHAKQNGDGTITLVNKACGLALDVRGGKASQGTLVQAYPQNGTDAQKFTVKQLEGAYSPKGAAPFEIVPKASESMRVDAKNGGMTDGTRIQLYKSNSTNAQRWAIVDDGGGYWVVINVKSSKALDVLNGGK